MLAFGTPNRSFLPYLIKENYLDSLLSELKNYPFPDYNGQETIDEVNTLIKLTNSVSNNEEVQKRFKIYDEGFEQYIVNALANMGTPKNELEETIKDLHDDILPILVKLKYHYNRIRPNQLAKAFEMNLYPYQSKTSDSPAYPSGHALQSKIYCEVLGNKYPKYYNQLQALAKDISDSRLYMGIHYPSDCTFASYVAEVILKHPEFKKKYSI